MVPRSRVKGSHVSYVCSNLSSLAQEPITLFLRGLPTRGLCSTPLCRGFGSSLKKIIIIKNSGFNVGEARVTKS